MAADTFAIRPPIHPWNLQYGLIHMIHPTRIALTAALGLIVSAVTVHTATAQAVAAQAAKSTSIKISSLPFPITAPGTYVLTGNVTYAGNNLNPAITINPTGGAIVLDFKGFTITNTSPDDQSTSTSEGIAIQSFQQGSPVQSPITIRNCTITLFPYAISDFQVSDVTINNITFNETLAGGVANPAVQAVTFNTVSNARVSNCHFNGSLTRGVTGILDFQSSGGNMYNNNTFTNIFTPLLVYRVTPLNLVLDRCQFAAAPSN